MAVTEAMTRNPEMRHGGWGASSTHPYINGAGDGDVIHLFLVFCQTKA